MQDNFNKILRTRDKIGSYRLNTIHI